MMEGRGRDHPRPAAALAPARPRSGWARVVLVVEAGEVPAARGGVGGLFVHFGLFHPAMNGVLEWFRGGSAVAVALLVVAAAGTALFLERFYHIVLRSRVSGRPFIERAIQLVRGGKLEDAIRHCAQTKAVLPDVGLVILRSRTRDEDDLAHVARAATLSLLPPLQRRLSYLPALALTAVLLGLLGTLLGLREALDPAGPAAALGATRDQGIAQALEGLASGVTVALPLLLAHAYLSHQARTIAEHAEEFAARLINALGERPDVRLGHR